MAFTYDILGRLLLTPVLMVVIVSTVVIPGGVQYSVKAYGDLDGFEVTFRLGSPKATLADVASWLIQNETQESMTIRMLGRYV